MNRLKGFLSRMKVDWKSLFVAFLIACFAWIMHNLSADYSAFFQYRVHVITNIVGYAPQSVANENLLVRGRATGFSILRINNAHRGATDIEIAIDARYFEKVNDEEDLFRLHLSDVRDKIVEGLGDAIAVDFLENENLTFNFVRSSFKKVPVVASLAVSYKPQYMQVGKIELTPDSVLVYGHEKTLKSVTEVTTSGITYNSLNHSVQGYVTPVQQRDLRIDADKIHYSLRVERYVELERTVPVGTTHVPSGKTMIVLPSQVKVTYRVPFGMQKDAQSDGLSVAVDYRDFANSRSSKMIPSVTYPSAEVFSYSLDPKMVDCILSDEKQ